MAERYGYALKMEGWGGFIAGLKEMPRDIEREMRGVQRSQAGRIVSRAAAYAPRRSGRLAADTSIRVGRYRVTVIWNAPQGRVMEFATDYTRTRQGQTQTVHIGALGPTPRFAYKAWDEMAPTFGLEVLDAVADAAGRGGFWEVSG